MFITGRECQWVIHNEHRKKKLRHVWNARENPLLLWVNCAYTLWTPVKKYCFIDQWDWELRSSTESEMNCLELFFWMAVCFKAPNLKVNLSVGGWCVVETSSGNYSSGAIAATTCSLALTRYYLINIQQQCIVAAAFRAQFIVQSCFP